MLPACLVIAAWPAIVAAPFSGGVCRCVVCAICLRSCVLYALRCIPSARSVSVFPGRTRRAMWRAPIGAPGVVGYGHHCAGHCAAVARCFNGTPMYWVNLQAVYELDAARHKQDEIAREVLPLLRASCSPEDRIAVLPAERERIVTLCRASRAISSFYQRPCTLLPIDLGSVVNARSSDRATHAIRERLKTGSLTCKAEAGDWSSAALK